MQATIEKRSQAQLNFETMPAAQGGYLEPAAGCRGFSANGHSPTNPVHITQKCGPTQAPPIYVNGNATLLLFVNFW
jgi:hypothetical protein